MFDIITIGHATIDYFLKLSQAEIVTPKDGDSRICLDFADKIPVEDFAKAVGGNAPNTAVGCTRLGLKAAIVSWVGKDMEAEMILKALKEEGVELFWVKISEDERTDQSVVLNFEGERTILAYHFPRKYTLPVEPPEAKWVYLTSSGEDFEEFHQKVLGYASEVGAKLAYNPGMYEIAAGAGANSEVLGRCEVLILNSEEAGELAGEGFVGFEEGRRAEPRTVAGGLWYRAERIGDLARKLRRLGPRLVVITDGAGGSYAFDGESFFHIPSVAAEVVEMTGAGDSFSAGFLSARILGRDLEECLKWGNINAASVISKIGSQAGLLTREEIKEKLKA